MKFLQKFASFTSIVIVALTFGPTVNATNFETCLLNVQQGLYGVGLDIGGTDNHGRPVDVFNATALTYDLCIKACGTSQEPFNWSEFSQQFNGWLLPWLALVSQLPFGAHNKSDNLTSVFLTVGSPTLAAYSFVLTVLNKKWITNRFRSYTFPNVQNAINILSSLQQAPLEINMDLLPSLVVLPQNDQWWSKLAKALNYTHTWSISAATSIAWVILAFIFTVVDSFSGNIATAINANGQGVGSLWLWLLPIVVGWLQISPKCDSHRLLSAVQDANKKVYVATVDGNVEQPENEQRAVNLRLFIMMQFDSQIESEFLHPVSLPHDPESIPLAFLHPESSESSERALHPVPLHPESLESLRLFPPESSESLRLLHSELPGPDLSRARHASYNINRSLRLRPEPLELLRQDEECTLPIYNYARFFPWVGAVEKVSEVFRAASDKNFRHVSVNQRWVRVAAGNFNNANRVGTLQQVNAYCQPDQLDQRHHWGLGNLYRISLASILALFLQWSTAGAAIVVNWFTPTRGLGCRSGSYLLYAVLSTIVWMLLLSSSLLTHYCAERPDGYIISGWSRKVAKYLSITLRRLGKIIATLNTMVIILACVLQFANFFDRCFCNSSVFSLRDRAYNVIWLSADDISGIKWAWIGGVCLAAVSVGLYFGIVSLWINLALP